LIVIFPNIREAVRDCPGRLFSSGVLSMKQVTDVNRKRENSATTPQRLKKF